MTSRTTRTGDVPAAPMAYQEGQLIQLTIVDVAHGGWCVARPGDGPVVFVRHALPGETVRARVTEVTSRLARAEAVEILTPSPDRVPERRRRPPDRTGNRDCARPQLRACLLPARHDTNLPRPAGRRYP